MSELSEHVILSLTRLEEGNCIRSHYSLFVSNSIIVVALSSKCCRTNLQNRIMFRKMCQSDYFPRQHPSIQLLLAKANGYFKKCD